MTFASFDATRTAHCSCEKHAKTPHRAPSPRPTVRRSKNDLAGLAPLSFTPSAVGTVTPGTAMPGRQYWPLSQRITRRPSLRLLVPSTRRGRQTHSARERVRSSNSLAALSDSLHFRDSRLSRPLTPAPSPGRRGEEEKSVSEVLTRTHRGRPYRPAVRRSSLLCEV